MSQRSEKLRRQVMQLRADVNALQEQQLTMEKFNSALQSVTEESNARQILAERRKTREAQHTAQVWKLNAVLALILAALTGCVGLAVKVRAAEKPAASVISATDEGRLPGDDVPAQEPPAAPADEAPLPEGAHVLEGVTVTHYDICKQCCGKTDGITASGARATPYSTVAVDPAMIPLGSVVLVDYGDGELHQYRAEDTGSAIKGRCIDLCVSSHSEALQLGRRSATVYWANPEVK